MDIQEKKSWIIKNKYLILLILILIFAFIIRIQYLNINKAVWWDSADYLMTAKEIGGVTDLDTYNLNPKRPFFIPLVWSLLYRLGGNETWLHISEIILSLLAVLFTYLIAKEFFTETAALIASFMMAVLWMPIFFTHRLLTDVPALALWLITVFYFWKGYIKEEGNKYIYYAAIALGFSIFTRAASIINIIPLAIIMLIKQRLNLFKDKKFWLAVIILLLVLSPFIIWIASRYDNPIQEFMKSRGRKGEPFQLSDFKNLWTNLNYITSTLLTPYLSNMLTPNLLGLIIILLIIYLSLDALIGFDIIIKNRDNELIKKLFLLILIFTPYVFYSLFNPGIEDRYLITMYPFMFMLFGVGLIKLKIFLTKYNKILSTILIITILLIFGFFHIKTTDTIIKSKADSYAQVAYAGKWLKENTYPVDHIITSSKFQNQYYSERETYSFPQEESEFLDYIKRVNATYIIISIFEPGFTPEWTFNFPQKYPNTFMPVQAYYLDSQQKQLALVIYKINKDAL